MSWKDILKSHCGGNREKTDEDDNEEEKALYGNQKRIDVAKPKGRITRADFDKLRFVSVEITISMFVNSSSLFHICKNHL